MPLFDEDYQTKLRINVFGYLAGRSGMTSVLKRGLRRLKQGSFENATRLLPIYLIVEVGSQHH
jgi:hypothetical protein